MEQTIIDFFAKASELILHNRLSVAKTLEAALNQITNPNPLKFQLSFDQKFNFSAKIPPQWTSHNNKLLVLEFFLCQKANPNEKFLVEQWAFELNQVHDSKLKYTIDSPNTLYKKLSVLLRTISLLTMSLPLYRSFIGDKSSPLWEYYTLEHSINFTRHTLSNWHPSVHEEKNLGNYMNPDLVLPGRNFAFKVNHPKSLGFLQAIIDDPIDQEGKKLKGMKDKVDAEYFGFKRRTSDGAVAVKSIRKSTSDSNKANISSVGNLSPAEPNQVGSEAVSDNASPFGSILTSSPIETQKSPRQIEGRSRKSSGGLFPWDQNKNGGNRPRFKTIDSESSGEYDMYVYEDNDGKFTEVLSGREFDIREEPPSKFVLHPKGSEESQSISDLAKKIEKQELKLSVNAKPIEKIIEQTDDDKIAELIHIIEELKDHYYAPSKPGKAEEEKNEEEKKGFRFYLTGDNTESSDSGPRTVSVDYRDFQKLYMKLKKEN